MAEKENYIGKSKLKEKTTKLLKFKLIDACIKPKHLSDASVTTDKIKDKAVTPEKRSDNFDNEVVKPYVNAVDGKYSGITNQLDSKFDNITDELYSMIASLQVGGIALSGKFGNRTDIGIHQKALTSALGRLWDELGEVTGKDYMRFNLTVNPAFIPTERAGVVTVTADSTDAISNFDSIRLYLDDELKAESHDIDVFTQAFTISEKGTHTVKAVGIILGRTIIEEKEVIKAEGFFIGSGQNYEEAITPECSQDLEGTLEGAYDVTVKNTGEHIFIIIPISHRDEFRRADMNGLGMKIEIPMNATVLDDYVVYKSLNTYKAGTYNIDIDINS